MTRKTHDGYYVTAIHGSGSAMTSKVAWLLGPFTGPRAHLAALAMVAPVRHACLQHSDDPRFAFASFGTARMTKPIDKPLPPGRLNLTTAVDDVWRSYVIYGRRDDR